ncbi:MAG: N-acetylmuramoyl-L-alanine amidase [Sphingobacteriales bacterium]
MEKKRYFIGALLYNFVSLGFFKGTKIGNVKKILLVVLLPIWVVCVSFSETGNDKFKEKITTIVIDAGHGGHDPGCSGKFSKEKNVALDIALKLGRYIEENIPEVNVIYTRKTDVFIELYERARIANEANADLFISIHCNANHNTSAYGTETITMGLHKSKVNLETAQRENGVILLEDNYEQNYDGFDPSSPEAYIMFSMFQNAFLDRSIDLASKVEQQFRDRVSRKSRGVKQAGLLVLFKTTMPSILVETGFLTNPKEERFLNSKDGQSYIASAIYRAFKEYKNGIEGVN